jgi:hypothetical protein
MTGSLALMSETGEIIRLFDKVWTLLVPFFSEIIIDWNQSKASAFWKEELIGCESDNSLL